VQRWLALCVPLFFPLSLPVVLVLGACTSPPSAPRQRVEEPARSSDAAGDLWLGWRGAEAEAGAPAEAFLVTIRRGDDGVGDTVASLGLRAGEGGPVSVAPVPASGSLVFGLPPDSKISVELDTAELEAVVACLREGAEDAGSGGGPEAAWQTTLARLAEALGVRAPPSAAPFERFLQLAVRVAELEPITSAIEMRLPTMVGAPPEGGPFGFWGGGSPPLDVPSFAWPPPAWSRSMELDPDLLPDATAATVGDFGRVLVTALKGAGYSQLSYYPIPGDDCSDEIPAALRDGFVIFTSLETIDSTAERVRFGYRTPTLAERIASFVGGGNHFRVLGFAATACRVKSDEGAPAWTRGQAERVSSGGDVRLRDVIDVGRDAGEGFGVVMLLYEFELPFEKTSGPEPDVHLQKAGIRAQLVSLR